MISPEGLQELTHKIIQSGALGRSKTYIRLLEYLVSCSIDNRAPKEIEIAIEVMDRDASFDVSKDSLVRVYIHNLRRKLEDYYKQFGAKEDFLIHIPKGQYTLSVSENLAPRTAISKWRVGSNRFLARFDALHWSLLAALTLSVGVFGFLWQSSTTDASAGLDGARSHPIWRSILNDDKPIVLVLGDYYIFGEINSYTGQITRMVREFDINSKQDLEAEILGAGDENFTKVNLDLSYLPTSSAFALKDILPVIAEKHRSITVRTMGELDIALLKSHHVIYVGYISGMEKLTTLAFQGSRYRIGETEDEIMDLQSGQNFVSGAGIPKPDKRFRDYGFISTFPTPDGTQILLISGTRDGGLMHTAKAVTDLTGLNALLDAESQTDVVAFEALYEVFGYDGRNFEAKLLNASQLHTDKIWSGSLVRMSDGQ